MTVRLLINIGSTDARRLGIDRTLAGEAVDVPEPVAAEMVAKGWAAPDGAGPATLRAVPPAPVVTSAQLPADAGAVHAEDVIEDGDDLESMTKHELMRYAADNDVRVVQAMSKAEIVAAIRAALD